MSKGLGEKIFEWVIDGKFSRPIALTASSFVTVAQIALMLTPIYKSDTTQETEINHTIQPPKTVAFKDFTSVDECLTATGEDNGCRIYFNDENKPKNTITQAASTDAVRELDKTNETLSI